MATTDLALWRSVRSEQFPDGTVVDGVPVAGVLYPDFYARDLPGGGVRAPDVEVFCDANAVEWVRSGGGTSLFDRAGVFRGRHWLSFAIPAETVIPDSLTVLRTHYNQRFQANHYQIECRALTMRVDAFKGALDNFARNAIVRAVELAR